MTAMPDWVQKTLDKYVGQKNAPALPRLGRNVQPEIERIQAVTNCVVKYDISNDELSRLKDKTLILLKTLESRQNKTR